jgi:hypothetical protein
MRVDNRTDFNETWLFERPSGIGQFETFDQLDYIIKDRISHGAIPSLVKENIYKIVGNYVQYYWYQIGNAVALAVEFNKKPQGLIVTVLGKSPQFRGKFPYASDLYKAVLDDNDYSIRITSDTQLSTEGFNLWKRMLQDGYYISIYDNSNPGKNFQTLSTVEDMEQFFKHDDNDYLKYQFVLSGKRNIGETRSFFHTRRYRELSGLLLV